MDLSTAQEQFGNLINSVKPSDIQPFLDWVKDSFTTSLIGKEPESDNSDILIQEIVQTIRGVVPVCGIFDSEKITWPENDSLLECSATNTIHVDAFLYDEDDIDEMCDAENSPFSRNYCLNCGSHKTAALNFISHSVSVKQLKFVFRNVLPQLNGKILVDVGSRLGGVLYAACLFSGASKIIGIEINSDLCTLQRRIVEQFRLSDKVRVVCDDVRNVPYELHSANVIVLNNVFQFFHSNVEQQSRWNYLHQNIAPSSILVCIPGLDFVTNGLSLDFSLNDWVDVVPIEHLVRKVALDDPDSVEDLSKICIYQVKQKVS